MADVYDEYDDEPYDYEDEDDGLDECGLTDDGRCMMAGSEHCDFTCPMRDSEFFAGSKAWREKHRRQRKPKSPDLLAALSPTTDDAGGTD